MFIILKFTEVEVRLERKTEKMIGGTGRKWRPSLQNLAWSCLLDGNQGFQVYHGTLCACMVHTHLSNIQSCIHTVLKENQPPKKNNITSPLPFCLILACPEMLFCEAKDVALSEWTSWTRTQVVGSGRAELYLYPCHPQNFRYCCYNNTQTRFCSVL